MWTTTLSSWATTARMPSLPCCIATSKDERFRLATRDAGPYFDSDHVGRGAAFGDLDDDGDIDIVVNHKDGAPALLRNDTQTDNHWIRLSLVGTVSNRDAVGARVEVELAGRTLVRQRKGGASLESSHDPRLLIGLGQEAEARKVTIRWPSGRVSVAEHLAADTSYRVVEPRGRVDAASNSFEIVRDGRDRALDAPASASK